MRRLLLALVACALSSLSLRASIAPQAGVLQPGEWFRGTVTLGAGHAGLRVNVTGDVVVVLRRGAEPDLSTFDYREAGDAPKTVVLLPGAENEGTWHVGVSRASDRVGGASFSIEARESWALPLGWDPGTTDAGTVAVTEPDTRGGRHLYALVAGEPVIRATRVRLEVTAGEASLHLGYGRQDLLPASGYYNSARTGSDGFLFPSPSGGTELTVLVDAAPGSRWRLVAGEAWAQPLPSLEQVDGAAAPGSANAAVHPFTIPPEGMRLFRAWASSSTAVPAWRLWAYRLAGSTAETWGGDLAIARARVAMVDGDRDWQQPGQMLVVPPYLGEGGDAYFLALEGQPGESGLLDSRPQPVTTIPFASHAGAGGSGEVTVEVPAGTSGQGRFGYRTFRVDVPIQQLGWEVTTTPVAGSAAVAVRAGAVPSEWFNAAFAEAEAPSRSSLTLAPPVLTDGAWYVTVYGPGPYSVRLSSRAPAPPAIGIRADDVTTAQPERGGWHYVALTDIDAQLGMLGWQLELAGAAAGTELAIRRNALPIRWNSRMQWGQGPMTQSHLDEATSRGVLQRPDQPADVWYVGVHNPVRAVGDYRLDAFPIEPTPLADFDAATTTVAAPQPGAWRYFRVSVPAAVAGQPVLGWWLRLADVESSDIQLQVRRDRLPPGGNGVGLGSTWPSGSQVYGAADLTGRTTNATGTRGWDNQYNVLLGMGAPLEPGVYFVGVYAGESATSYRLESRGIGAGLAYAPRPLAFAGGSASITGLAPRDMAFFAVDVPAGTASWELALENAGPGETRFALREGVPPGSGAWYGSAIGPAPQAMGLLSYRDGDERLLVAERVAGEGLRPGRHLVAVIGEGTGPVAERIGTGEVGATLRSLGPVAPTSLGTVANDAPIASAVSYAAGQHRVYRFTIPAGLSAVELLLDDRIGNPVMSVARGEGIPYKVGNEAYSGTTYGLSGGVDPVAHATTVASLSNPEPGTYTVIVGDGSSHYAPPFGTTRTAAGSATLRIESRSEVTVAMDGGSASVTSQAPGTWRYFRIDVPEDAALLGWDLRVVDASGWGLQSSIRRGQLPPHQYFEDIGYSQGYTDPAAWPDGAGMSFIGDPTQRYAAEGREGSWYLHQGMVEALGHPVEPGTYYLGVFNGDAAPRSYRVVSRAIGAGKSIPVPTLAYSGGSATATGLSPRELRVFAVDVPEGARSWRFAVEVAGGGEALALVRRARVPSFRFSHTAPFNVGAPLVTQRVAKDGGEEFVIAPNESDQFLVPGRYYVGVMAEGDTPPNSYTVGEGLVDVTIRSLGPLPVAPLGALEPGATLTEEVAYRAGEVRAYSVEVAEGTLALEVRLDGRVGNPTFAIARGALPPGVHGNQGYSGTYGMSTAASALGGGLLFTVPQPTPGTYTILVADGSSHHVPTTGTTRVADGSASLVVTALATAPLAFDGGRATVESQPAGSWRYFVVDVPASVAGQPVEGWELRLLEASGDQLQVSVRRDLAPPYDYFEALSYPRTGDTPEAWPSGRGRDAASDFTQRGGSADATRWWDANGLLVAAMGRKFEPGRYVIGVRNQSTEPRDYVLRSRGIGAGLAIEPAVVAFAGGTASFAGVEPRDWRLAKVIVPEGARSWRLSLAPSSGEARLVVRQGFVPDELFSYAGEVDNGQHFGVVSHREGRETLVVAPAAGREFLAPGAYYVALVSEGVNPPSPSQVGALPVDFAFSSGGELPVTLLGDLGQSASLGGAFAYEAGDTRAFRFTVPAGLVGLTVRLEDRVGNPTLALVAGSSLPTPHGNQPYVSRYGFSGGRNPLATGTGALSVDAPAAGDYTLVVADGSSHYVETYGTSRTAAGAFTLIVEPLRPAALNLAASQNAAGGTNVAEGTLAAGEKRVFEVVVPEGLELDGSAILGWTLRLSTSQGTALMRLHHDPAAMAEGISLGMGRHLVAPPYLRAGAWRVEVTAPGAAVFTLESDVAVLRRPAWTMPALGASVTTPGLSGNAVGDTGIDPAGTALPGDQGIDIGEGDLHYYAVEVPAGNAGLLRTAVVALNGNPDLFLRRGALPTRSHGVAKSLYSGWTGEAIDRRLVGSGTEYGNWVPLDGLRQQELPAGTYYLAVLGNGTNVRYRLRLSAGNPLGEPVPASQRNVQALALDGSTLTGQALAAGDWRYYRFQVPEDARETLTVTTTSSSGAFVMYLREGVPPGEGTSAIPFADSTNSTWGIDWSDDAENSGHSPWTRPTWPGAGTHVVTTPPLRPGSTYVLGFRATNDAVFGLSAAFSGPTLSTRFGAIASLDFFTGVIDTTLAAGASRLWKVAVPADARRWRHAATHGPTFELAIEEGTLPTPEQGHGAHHLAVGGVDTPFSRLLDGAPWAAGRTFYVRVRNTAATPQPFRLAMDGRTAETDDEDNDGMPDAWEERYFQYAVNVTADADPDEDGVRNLDEFRRGTDPSDAASVLYRVSARGVGATVAVDPARELFGRGETATLTATPAAGTTFLGWSRPGQPAFTGTTWPVTLEADLVTVAHAGIALGEALDAPALAWVTGGSGLGVGVAGEGRSGDDAVVITGDYPANEDGWVETTVQAPGSFRFSWRLEGDPTWLSTLVLEQDGVWAIWRSTAGGWVDQELQLAGSGERRLRFRLVGRQPQATAPTRAFLDGVSYVRVARPQWNAPTEFRANSVRLNWRADPGVGSWIWQVARDLAFTQLVASQWAYEPTAVVMGLEPDTIHYARVYAYVGGVQGESSTPLGFRTLAFDPDGFMAWAESAGINPMAPLADADGDGYTALEEYAFGLDPAVRSPNPFTFGTETIDGVRWFTVSVVIRVDDDALDFRVFGGDSLPPSELLEPTSLFVRDPEPVGIGFERITLRSSVPLTPEHARAFFRLEVSRTPPGG